jgi:P27 family predicted phage terminase small subunit
VNISSRNIKIPPPPPNLSVEARRLWRRLHAGYNLTDEAGMILLATGLEAFDRMRGAQRLLNTEGVTVLDRFGQMRSHPAATIERDSRSAFMQALKALHLDLEPLKDGPGRPPGGDGGLR